MAGGLNPIGNLLGKVDANGALLVAISGGTISPTTILAGDGTASAPSYSFASEPGLGLYRFGSGDLAFSDGSGNARFTFIDGVAFDIRNDSAQIRLGVGLDVSLSRGAAGRVNVSGGATPTVAVVGASSQRMNLSQVTTSLTTNSGIGTATATNLIPAGSLVVGVDARVTTVIAGAGGLTSFSLGDGTDADRWGAAIALAAGTTVTLANATITSAPIYAAATSVVLTANAGQFDSGVIRLTVHYLSLTAATS